MSKVTAPGADANAETCPDASATPPEVTVTIAAFAELEINNPAETATVKNANARFISSLQYAIRTSLKIALTVSAAFNEVKLTPHWNQH
jgi:hypothetical protein